MLHQVVATSSAIVIVARNREADALQQAPPLPPPHPRENTKKPARIKDWRHLMADEGPRAAAPVRTSGAIESVG